MRKFFYYSAWVIGMAMALLAILLLVAPTHVHIEQSVFIHAPPAAVWDQTARFDHYNQWNTLKEREPGAQFRIDGVDGTAGASTTWTGKKIGFGRLRHLSLTPHTEIRQQLEFFEPLASICEISFKFADSAGGTRVAWSMDAKYPRPQNILGMFMKDNLETDFRKSLQRLKSAAEANFSAGRR
ncbi:SRPBCC family protein [Chitinophaga rhizosphaerae]|uniref:SRPBCC family protein n=1 Tax=Chitinophaga rhizosphaerae TaxID=1864947 RepID=UPI000F7FB15F|nr:SRPBCC family protein [Chitinophaga rhizosphaerae]